ncbi:MAG TPA: glycoside hydrolase family 30 beta sandwich domain-containing protein [Calditrichia bacterium]|nr:glucosylceramidase [Calditrichota bacterium]HQV31158.1 glycoside hydrolase family 30 beta sandwich domain-containing protein [Calditrichia bacterium]
MGCGKSATPAEEGDGTLQFWLSDPQSTARFAKQEGGVNTGRISSFQDISLDSGVTYQSMDGFGFALTGGSALHINNMSAGARETLLKNLFGTDGNQIGVSYLRVSIGASDLDEAVFSYNDLPAGQSDLNMDQFSLDPDRRYLIPVLKEILLINPEIKILGSPWSPPTWMKTNNSSIGGSLRPQYYDTYALYFVKYLQGMAAEGIPIDAITVQNEPLHGGNNPSMVMQASEQAAFIKNSLGPALRGAGLQTKIIVWDHNADNPDYPIEVLNDPAARGYVDGSAFHLYGGDISALSTVHSAHPDKNLYFTEQWIGAPGNFPNDLRWHVRELIIGASRNWAKAVIEWNLAADSNQDPHTPGGCTECLGAVTIEGDNVIRNPAYYIIAHAAKFVRPGSRRISSTSNGDLPNVAFLTPDGAAVIIVLNNGGSPASFNIVMGNKAIHSQLNAGAVGTYVWR